jgi:ribosomal protein S18 acetylase RimI-like enzyme
MNATVRLATPADDQAIGEILVAGYVTAYARKMPQVIVSDERKRTLRDVAGKRTMATVLVVEHEGRVAGTVAIFKPGAPTSEAWLPGAADLRHLAVEPTLHGKGLATPLLDEAERIVRDEWQAKAICLHVRKGNFGVARLYQSRGYRRSKDGDLSYPDVELEAYVLSFRETRVG